MELSSNGSLKPTPLSPHKVYLLNIDPRDMSNSSCSDESPCLLSQEFRWFHNRQGHFKAICNTMTDNPCANYHLNLGNDTICHVSKMHGRTLDFWDTISVSLIYSLSSNATLKCYLWCTFDGSLPEEAPVNDEFDALRVHREMDMLNIKELSLGRDATHDIEPHATYHVTSRNVTGRVQCLDRRCSYSQTLKFEGPGESCNATFFCKSMARYPDGDFGLSLSLGTDEDTPYNHYVGPVQRGVLKEDSPAEIDLWLSNETDVVDVDCYFFCKPRGYAACNCGEANRLLTRRQDPRKYPWQVQILMSGTLGGFQLQCSGALLDDRHVITSAHCFGLCPEKARSVLVGQFRVAVGTHDVGAMMTESTHVRGVDSVLIHPNFTFNWPFPQNNVALVRLDRAVEGVQPICLPLHQEENFEGFPGFVAGWGGKKEEEPCAHAWHDMTKDVMYHEPPKVVNKGLETAIVHEHY